jgi:DNA-directed RNA polymerase specialized sigma24 family protein
VELTSSVPELALGLEAFGRRAACSPKVKQVEVICHLMHADFSYAFFYTVAWRMDLQWSLQQAMFSLSPQCRSIVRLHCFRQLSFSEIARRLNMPVLPVGARV